MQNSIDYYRAISKRLMVTMPLRSRGSWKDSINLKPQLNSSNIRLQIHLTKWSWLKGQTTQFWQAVGHSRERTTQWVTHSRLYTKSSCRLGCRTRGSFSRCKLRSRKRCHMLLKKRKRNWLLISLKRLPPNQSPRVLWLEVSSKPHPKTFLNWCYLATNLRTKHFKNPRLPSFRKK